jgi:hypothetical protein
MPNRQASSSANADSRQLLKEIMRLKADVPVSKFTNLVKETELLKHADIESFELTNLVTNCFKLHAKTLSGLCTETGGPTYWLIGTHRDIAHFNQTVKNERLEQLAREVAYIRTGHRKIDPINRYNPRIKQLETPQNRLTNTPRQPTQY